MNAVCQRRPSASADIISMLFDECNANVNVQVMQMLRFDRHHPPDRACDLDSIGTP